MRRAALAVAWTAFLLSFVPHLPHSTDDAFITHRCAWNLAVGQGLAFNPGEVHLATTAPGFAILLGALGFFFGPAAIPHIAGALALVSLGACVVILARCFAPTSPAILPMLLCATAASRWLVEILGHETPTQALLIVTSLAILDRDRPIAAGVLLALATAVRPDSVAFGAVIGLRHWIVGRRMPLRLALGFALPVPILFGGIFALAGTLRPASLAVKRAEASMPLLSFDHTYLSSLIGWFERDYGLGALALLGLALAGLVTSSLRPSSCGSRGLAVLAAGATAFYPLVGVTFAPWYFVIPLLALLFWASFPIAESVEKGRWLIAATTIGTMALTVSSSLPWLIANGSSPPDPRMVPNRAVAEWVREHSQPNDSMAAVEVGFLAYFSDRPVVDLLGLGSPGALDALVQGRVADYFFARAPTFLVRHPVFDYVQGPILTDPRFAESYALARSFSNGPAEPVIEVYRRRGA